MILPLPLNFVARDAGLQLSAWTFFPVGATKEKFVPYCITVNLTEST